MVRRLSSVVVRQMQLDTRYEYTQLSRRCRLDSFTVRKCCADAKRILSRMAKSISFLLFSPREAT